MKSMSRVIVLSAAISLILFSMPLIAQEADARIETSAKTSYVFVTYLQNDDIRVESDEGVVTLSGTVAEAFHKALAEDTASSLPGVKHVKSELSIENLRSGENSDARLTTKVKSTLLFHHNVGALTDVSAVGGVVTLRGNADNQAQKNLAAEYAKDIEGVADVKNEIAVVDKPRQNADSGYKIDDASITSQVKMVLMSYRSTSSLYTGVATQDGEVTLSRMARNEAERTLASKIVGDVKGVEKVNNTMTIAMPVANL